VAIRQRNDLRAPIIEKWIGSNYKRVDLLLTDGCENSLEVAFSAGIEDTYLTPERAHCRLQFRQLRLCDWVIRIYEHSDDSGCGNQLEQKLQPLCHGLGSDQRYAGDIAARSIEAGDEPETYGVAADHEHDRNGRSRRLCRADRRSAGSRDDNGYLSVDEISCQPWEPIVLTVRIAVLDPHVAALGITSFA
jgi:hypothetical protein